MQIPFSLRSSRFARRILLLFLLCAFLPTLLLVGFAYQRVKKQLYEQSWVRMEKECKTYALGIFDRLAHMDNLARLAAPSLSTGLPVAQLPAFQQRQIAEKFSGLGLYRPGSGLEVLHGHLDQALQLSASFDSYLQVADKTTLFIGPSDILPKPIYLLVPVEEGSRRGLLVARPEESLLWGTGMHSLLPAMTEMAVYDHTGSLIAATLTSPGEQLPSHANRSQSRYLQFEYSQDHTSYLASGWSLFLTSHFNAATWTVILSASVSDVLSAMLNFQYTFPLIILLTLWIVLFLALYFIRRTLTPLAMLREGTKRISARDFTQPLRIASGDEFEQLADSFNSMASQLHQQFNTLALIDQIDRAILSSLDASVIIPRSLRLIADFFSCSRIILARCSTADPYRLLLTILSGTSRNDLTTDHAVLDEKEWSGIFADVPHAILSWQAFPPSFHQHDSVQGEVLVLPLKMERRIQGALLLEFATLTDSATNGRIAQARQLADQLSIALENARLVADLEQLSIGAVEALARTVDAKSKWTSGHSERVAELAIRIGQAMHCGRHLLDQLHRGGLLHDIGKIGIPIAILDKPGRLDEEEYNTIKTHPELGGKILEPIQPYQEIIPIIVQHHERFDGKGYPKGLAGEAISLGARILALADVYDALISQRPYRSGWVKEQALGFIRDNTGSMFDPQVAEAFFSLEV